MMRDFESRDSFCTQGLNRVHRGGATCRQIARNCGGRKKTYRNHCEGCGVGGFDAK